MPVSWLLAPTKGIALPDRDYYLKPDPPSLELRKAYVAHVTKMFELAGEPAARARTDTDAVLKIETALAKASLDVVARRDPASFNHKMSLQQLEALTPSFNWSVYLKQAAAPAPQHYLVVPDFYKGLETQLKTVPLDQWKAYLRWHVLHSSAPLLSDAFVNEDFNFFGSKLTGQKEITPRWRRCTSRIDTDLGEALGQAYVQRAFSPEAKQRMLKMVDALDAALARDIQQLDWMTPTTKQQAAAKLKAIEDKIGYPDHWRDYSSVSIVRGDLLGDALRSSEFEFHRQLNKIGKPVDRGEWGMTPPTVNAYYDPQLNTINFPAGILQPPFFDPTKDDAVNYGAIGMVIGHEIIHGFDDQGRKFDAKGNLRDWWTA
ncbi:MAG: M13 family metallopeptidase, partial [Acidobacteria bacterium]|nr:M13 family metallopeptidase [Acidobacteriota bacterium]